MRTETLKFKVTFNVFWEAMLIPMYLLIAVWGGPNKTYASIKFFLYTLAGSVLLLVAIIALYLSAGTFSIPELMGRGYSFAFQFWVFLAFALAFAIKVPMFPFHTWLPAAHVEAPTAGSVILASVLLKMGTYGFLRFCLPITPLAVSYLAPVFLWGSIVSILYGGFVAFGQKDMTKLIAYSSVGHMGFVTLGIFLVNQRGIEGAIRELAVPVGLYLLAITAMVTGAALADRPLTLFVGALSFAFSDAVIAINKFVAPVPQAGLVIMLSYYLAQWLLWSGAMHTAREPAR